ncbi:DUF6176 family protein [Metaplanococcus flavidus]|uniref:DUF6176 family protein n=1 Tax=Metaplanococcus flavidus TaxID=569883 RepID=A0ABW3LB64_9BACL
MNVELTKFRVKEGKSAKVDEWLAFLNDNMKDVLVTLEGEKMYVETIFRESLDCVEYLYWYSIQGEGGQEVETSTHWIDEKHMAFWHECIDSTFPPVDLPAAVIMIPSDIKEGMK